MVLAILAFSRALGNRRVNPNAPVPPPPTDVKPLMDALGVAWPKDQIVWDKYNPHPQLGALPEEILFIAAANEASETPFNEDEAIDIELRPGEMSPIG